MVPVGGLRAVHLYMCKVVKETSVFVGDMIGQNDVRVDIVYGDSKTVRARDSVQYTVQ